jgi:hypothetical protein
MTARIMYDSTDADRIPLSAQMVAGYVTGRYRWSTANWARFPHASHIRIDVDGSAPFASDVADVERYDLTIPEAVAWVKKRHEVKGWWSCCYISLNGLADLRAAMGSLPVEYWVAQWTGHPHAVDGARVCSIQYANTPGFDLSVVPNAAWFPTTAALVGA